VLNGKGLAVLALFRGGGLAGVDQATDFGEPVEDHSGLALNRGSASFELQHQGDGDELSALVFKRFANLFGERQRFVSGNRAGVDAFGKRGAFDQFHDESVGGAGIFEAVDRGNIGMIERGEEFCFAAEAAQAIGIGGNSGRQDFERDFAAQLAVAGAVYLAHAAHTKKSADFVKTNFGSGHEGHGLLEL